MNVLMFPGVPLPSGENGIGAVVRAYIKHLPKFDINVVSPNESFDLVAVHAGGSNKLDYGVPLVAHTHGLYWTADYPSQQDEYAVNAAVIASVRHAAAVTVPSNWVAETFRRDMHLNPFILGHGIDWVEWQDVVHNEGYVLWNKNRTSDVCSTVPLAELARRAPRSKFVSTFAPKGGPGNIREVGLQPHGKMRQLVQSAGVYLSTTKETFGIGILEAMASGVPVLGFRQGGILDLVEHRVNGYLAEPGNYDDLAEGLAYCLANRKELGDTGRTLARSYTWETVVEKLAYIYRYALTPIVPEVTVVIPCYNQEKTLGDCLESVLAQTFPPYRIIVVDNNSTDGSAAITLEYVEKLTEVSYAKEPRQGVAHARNAGIGFAETKYVCCLDGDDQIAPDFLRVCVEALEADPSLGIAYTGLGWHHASGSLIKSDWPGPYNYDKFVDGANQVPTCCVFRREVWERLGGYRQRYAPKGAGAEDAEFFLRAGAIGFGAKFVTSEPLFLYSAGTGITAQPDYKQPNWRFWHPWVKDKQFPFASMATPKLLSHPVRQYDEPVISVVIPCGPNHVDQLVDALDSLEAQDFRQWEAIVVFDTGNTLDGYQIMDAYPFVRILRTDRVGAGAARNAGAAVARGAYLLFLDADDWLRPAALSMLLDAAMKHDAIAYSDYTGHAYVESEFAKQLAKAGRLIGYDERDQYANIAYTAFDYDRERAIREPVGDPDKFYIWCLVSSLLPKLWHDEIGGFDESLESWEDWDYWLRLARAGKNFVRVPHRLVDYKFFSGTRRENGRQLHKTLLQYLQAKFKEIPIMPCHSCGKKHASNAPSLPFPIIGGPQAQGAPMSAADMVMIQLVDGNSGQHPIVGPVTRRQYGYRVDGEEFLVHISDFNATDIFVRVTEVTTEDVLEMQANALLPVSIENVPGLSARQIKILHDAGVETLNGVIILGEESLAKIKGITPETAQKVYKFAADVMQN